MPYYATYTGHINSGVFTTWDDCKKEIHKKPKYKKFATELEAQNFNKFGPFSAEDESFEIVVYTDGACQKNGTKNAIAGFGVYFGENHPKNTSQRLTGTVTNNIAELSAVICALKLLAPDYGKKIGIYTDSTYVLLCTSSYGDKCKKKGWDPEIPNIELVKEAHTLVKEHNITMVHVTAHTLKCDIHSNGNREADKLATQSLN